MSFPTPVAPALLPDRKLAAQNHLDFLDHFRGLAILMVFSFHALGSSFDLFRLPWDGWVRDYHVPFSFLALYPATLGGTGVALFFVISGFCIHLSHEKARTKAFDVFFIRRFFRIYPPYLVALLVFAFLFPMTWFPAHDPHAVGLFLTHLFLVHNVEEYYLYGINASFWSIAVEAQLYLLYPLLLVLVFRLGWMRTLWLLAILELALRIVGTVANAEGAGWLDIRLEGWPFYYWFSWAIGAVLADDFLKGRPLAFSRFRWEFWAVLVIVADQFHATVNFDFTLAAVATATAISRCLARSTPATQGIAPRSFFSPWEHLRLTGLVSYSVYLIHQPLILAIVYLVKGVWPSPPYYPWRTFLICFGCWPLILLASWIFYRLFERPSMAVGKWILRRRESAKSRSQT
jgi:peptidoglycan/LPS O-acetylase OafA/YrhL